MTAQVADNIIIKGTKYSLFTNPLGSYWTNENPKPPIGRPSTGCWRGYVATWEIIDTNLFLVDVLFYAPGGDRGLDYIFPSGVSKIKASWYTGELRIPLGDCIKYVHGDYDSVFETDWFIKIKLGEVISQRYKANY